MQNVEQLIEQQQAEPFFEGDSQETVPAAASASEEASGRVDGSFGSLQCGEGNVPLHLKLELANKLGSFKPSAYQEAAEEETCSSCLSTSTEASSLSSFSDNISDEACVLPSVQHFAAD